MQIYLNVADSGPLPRCEGCGFSSSLATAAAKIPIADSAGGKLECPGFPVTLSSRVAEPFSDTPTLRNVILNHVNKCVAYRISNLWLFITQYSSFDIYNNFIDFEGQYHKRFHIVNTSQSERSDKR
ncbi:hypothetical protein C0J52_13761 [Blattella germanica]|nr:hypothetical protein C0J52_13761 [Blattella germanica]